MAQIIKTKNLYRVKLAYVRERQSIIKEILNNMFTNVSLRRMSIESISAVAFPTWLISTFTRLTFQGFVFPK